MSEETSTDARGCLEDLVVNAALLKEHSSVEPANTCADNANFVRFVMNIDETLLRARAERLERGRNDRGCGGNGRGCRRNDPIFFMETADMIVDYVVSIAVQRVVTRVCSSHVRVLRM